MELGSVGRSHGAILSLGDVSRWRAGNHGAAAVQRKNKEVLTIIETALVDTLKRDGAHERVDIKEGPASGLLAIAYKRIWLNLTRLSPDEFKLPAQIEQFCAIYVQYTEDPTSLRR